LVGEVILDAGDEDDRPECSGPIEGASPPMGDDRLPPCPMAIGSDLQDAL
jgi:hypothetical protein